MQKFLITPRSHNRVTGPIMVTTSPRRSCPIRCPLRKTAQGATAGACYAENGFLGGFIWSKLDQLAVGARFKAGQIQIRSLEELTAAIRALPEGALWRHNQAGDLCGADGVAIDEEALDAIVSANEGRRGFTYTHCDVLQNAQNRKAVARANAAGFTVNLSADTLEQADELAALNIAPVAVVLPMDAKERLETPSGRPVIICPAAVRKDMSCERCGICAKQRVAIVGLPARGRKAEAITAISHAKPSAKRRSRRLADRRSAKRSSAKLIR